MKKLLFVSFVLLGFVTKAETKADLVANASIIWKKVKECHPQEGEKNTPEEVYIQDVYYDSEILRVHDAHRSYFKNPHYHVSFSFFLEHYNKR